MSADPKAERRADALYAATTHTTKGTLLSDRAKTGLCEAFLELHGDFSALGKAHAALERAHEMNDQALDEALRQRDGLRRELARYRRETGGEG